MADGKPKIRIIPNGPYLVSGGVKLSEKIIASNGRGYVWKEGRPLPQAGQYALCRCGRSRSAPFCDGAHAQYGFTGRETAAMAEYNDRADTIRGPGMDLKDDRRCAFARFCHREGGNVWELTQKSDDPECRDEAIRAASDCPTGRLVAILKSGEEIEPAHEPGIEIVQDPERGVSAGIFVKGGIPIESADGRTYEVRGRAMLCRCGQSHDKPFCDAMHLPSEFNDGALQDD